MLISWRREQPTVAPSPIGLLGIKLGDSVGILGMRGTGKTHLAKTLYDSLHEATEDVAGYVIDSNVAGDFTGWRGGYWGVDPPIIRAGQLVWQPPANMLPDAYETFFERLYAAQRPAVLLIDEGNALGKGAHFFYGQLLKRGRARGFFRGITVISLWQELAQRADTPRQTFSQITHMIRFYVAHPYDRDEANRRMSLPTTIQPEHEHGFFHARLDKPPVRATYYSGEEAYL